MIGIVQYGLGNTRSVAGAVERLGFEPVLTDRPELLARADKLILPGVGAFGDGMKNLKDRGLVEALNSLVGEQHKPILGICLGFQLMAERGYEFGDHQGLGWIKAEVVKMETRGELRLPHVGWNDLFQIRESLLWEGIPSNALFYYVHSYHVRCEEEGIVVGESEYGYRFVAAVEKVNVYGTQFHPEKSQQWGLEVLRNFLERSHSSWSGVA
ncbi:MAG: imidazole glycerol phosphate synthase subunit HisH [Deltaproteobacteria bacterium]|nr:imidazole glycerol phosphate synthase subunit HisH [Deltaproteobacteria bacterium]